MQRSWGRNAFGTLENDLSQQMRITGDDLVLGYMVSHLPVDQPRAALRTRDKAPREEAEICKCFYKTNCLLLFHRPKQSKVRCG